MLKQIHINQSHLRHNAKHPTNRLPVVTIQTPGGRPIWADEVFIDGPSKVVSTKPQLNCGARVWVETEASLRLVGGAVQEVP